MKSKVELELLEEYLDGDVAAEEELQAPEQELFARYDRELEVPAALWSGIEREIAPVAETSFKWWLRVAAILLLTIGLGVCYLWLRTPAQKELTASSVKENAPRKELVSPDQNSPQAVEPQQAVAKSSKKSKRTRRISVDNPGVISADLGYLDIDERETARHIEQTENLLRSIRNFPISDTDDEVDVSYDKALSRRLLIENVVLRREAEMKAKFPTKTLLADLEPLLIDIANLPDQAKPEEVRVIKERVQKTEIVAALLDFQDRGPNNR